MYFISLSFSPFRGVYLLFLWPFSLWPFLLPETFELDLQGPVFSHEPPHKVEFSNSTGGHVECSGNGSPQAEVSRNIYFLFLFSLSPIILLFTIHKWIVWKVSKTSRPAHHHELIQFSTKIWIGNRNVTIKWGMLRSFGGHGKINNLVFIQSSVVISLLLLLLLLLMLFFIKFHLLATINRNFTRK